MFGAPGVSFKGRGYFFSFRGIFPQGRPGLTIADIIQVVDQFLCFYVVVVVLS